MTRKHKKKIKFKAPHAKLKKAKKIAKNVFSSSTIVSRESSAAKTAKNKTAHIKSEADDNSTQFAKFFWSLGEMDLTTPLTHLTRRPSPMFRNEDEDEDELRTN